MTRVWLLAVALAAGCTDAPPATAPAATPSLAPTTSPTPVKPAFKEPDPEIR